MYGICIYSICYVWCVYIVCVCIVVYMYGMYCMYACMNKCMYVCMYVRVYVCMYVWMIFSSPANSTKVKGEVSTGGSANRAGFSRIASLLITPSTPVISIHLEIFTHTLHIILVWYTLKYTRNSKHICTVHTYIHILDEWEYTYIKNIEYTYITYIHTYTFTNLQKFIYFL